MTPDNKLVTCHCKSCSGGIEFERDLFDPENPPVISCPHCGSEVHLYIPSLEKVSDTVSTEESPEAYKHKQVRFTKGTRVALTPAQSESSDGQELIGLLTEIVQAGLVTEEGVRKLNGWLDEKAQSDIPAIKFLLQTSDRILRTGKVTTASAFEMQFAIERVLPKSIRDEVKETRQEAWLHSPLKPKATEAQLEYIRGLGGEPQPDLNVAEASLLIQQLLEKNPQKHYTATEKQIQYLKVFGYVPDGPLTKEEASNLIAQFSEDPERQSIRDKDQADKSGREFTEREQNLAYHLHSEFDQAMESAEKAERGEIRDAKMYLKDTQNERLWFWQDTFRTPDQMEGSGTNEQSIKLYFSHGYRFEIPSEENTRAILDALDANSPSWDQNNPEYFFLTLEQNFPELVKGKIDFEKLEVLREIYSKPPNL